MQRFRFTLETLLELRRRKEDAVKLELARKQGEVGIAQGQLDALARAWDALQRVVLMRHAVAFRHKLKLDMLAKGRQIDELKAEAERIRKRLVKATQEVRALELLRERRFAEWRKEYRAEEQGFIDDVSQQGYIRKKKNVASRSPA
jgi:flagellar FliJ protein